MTKSRPFWVVGAVGAGWTFGALPLHFVETDVMEVFCIKFAIFRQFPGGSFTSSGGLVANLASWAVRTLF